MSVILKQTRPSDDLLARRVVVGFTTVMTVSNVVDYYFLAFGG
jgi:hypothetical protein